MKASVVKQGKSVPLISSSRDFHICPNNAISAPEDYKPIKKVTIIPEKCKDCSLCSRVCKAGAPTGKIKELFTINQEKCFKCGVCAKDCHFDAIKIEYE